MEICLKGFLQSVSQIGTSPLHCFCRLLCTETWSRTPRCSRRSSEQITPTHTHTYATLRLVNYLVLLRRITIACISVLKVVATEHVSTAQAFEICFHQRAAVQQWCPSMPQHVVDLWKRAWPLSFRLLPRPSRARRQVHQAAAWAPLLRHLHFSAAALSDDLNIYNPLQVMAANRGEIALRIMRAATELQATTVGMLMRRIFLCCGGACLSLP